MANTILVTGASGNIGKPLVQALKSAGASWAVMRSKPMGDEGTPTRVADFADVDALTQAFSGFHTLFVLLPLVPNKLELARNVAAAAKAAGIQHIVRASGAGADAASPFALPRLQGQIDEVLSATGIPCTFLRNAGFMQNYGTYQTQAVKDGSIYMADNGQAQSLIDARDIAAVAALVLQAPAAHAGKAYTLTGGESFTGAQAAAVISTVVGHEVKHVSVSPETAVATMQQWGMPAFIIEVMDSLNRIVWAGYAAAVSPDTERLLGRKPRGFAAYAAEQAAAWK
jgi:uncharacterized protein YbjT (DUF2867 family)